MFNYLVKAGTTDVSVVIRIIDSTDGTPETGVVYNTAGIDLEYRREGALSTDITEATLAALTTAHTDGGFLHIGNGYYRLDLPDAACAVGVTGVLVHGIVTGMVVIGCYIQLVTFDPFDTVRLGLTALPNAAADAAGGLPISDAGGLDIDAQKADITDIHTDVGTVIAKTDNLPDGVPKNAALSNFPFLMVLASDHVTPATGKTITAQISKDGGAFAACTNAASEIGSGLYKINFTATEMNADMIILKFTETNCDQRTITIVTNT